LAIFVTFSRLAPVFSDQLTFRFRGRKAYYVQQTSSNYMIVEPRERRI